jgi:hypothetical protein
MADHQTRQARESVRLVEVWDGLLTSLTDLARAAEQNGLSPKLSPEAFAQAQRQLGCVPLSWSEYALAQCRLRNARSYLRRGEIGAAQFELQQLARSLRTTARLWTPLVVDTFT